MYFFVFELADGDIRDVVDTFSKLDVVWCLRSLHDAAVGLKQLHASGISHQDLKPSNVIYQSNKGSSLADLGRSIARDFVAPHAAFSVAGDMSYAPLDLHYPSTFSGELEKRFLTDLYLLGSLVFFHFSNVSAVHALRAKLQGRQLPGLSFAHDLPYIHYAFEETLSDLDADVRKATPRCADEIVGIARQLCEPDPTRRGDPGWRKSHVPNYDVQRYISRFDRLSKEARAEIK